MNTRAPKDHAPFEILIRRARREAGMTQEELAERSGLSARTISDIERGICRVPRRGTLELLANALTLSDQLRCEWSRTRFELATSNAGIDTTGDSGARNTASRMPTYLSTFVGRVNETQTLIALIRKRETRLLTLTGTGGVGKTRLALAVAQAANDDYADGAWFVDLSPVTDPALVLTTIATTLNISVAATASIESALAVELRDKRLLLVLDNLEQIPNLSGRLSRLLGECPALDILATSRVPLHVYGEHEYPVVPLATPDSETSFDLGLLRQVEAVSLFLQRSREVRPDFQITQENAQVVIDLCRRLGGIPLIIELAAARMRSLPLAEVNGRLERSLTLLKSRAHDAPARQRTMHNTIQWSYDLLAPEEQRLFRRLGVFEGGWSLSSVSALVENQDEQQVLDDLEHLVEHSLVQVRETEDGKARFSMLELLRMYTLEQLDLNGELEVNREHHARYYLRLAQQAEPHLQNENQQFWIVMLEREHGNLRAALRWSKERSSGGDRDAMLIGLRLAAALWWFWHVHGHLREGRRHLDEIVETARPIITSLSSPQANRELRDAYADALLACATIAFWLSEHDQSTMMLDECISIRKDLKDEHKTARAVLFKSFIPNRTGDFATADALLYDSLRLMRDLGDQAGVALALLGFGELALRRGDFAHGEERTAECLTILAQIGDIRAITAAKANAGALRLCQGDLYGAERLLRESLEERHRIGDRGGIAWCLEWIAALSLRKSPRSEGASRAARLLGAARQLRDITGSAIDPADRPHYDQVLTTAQRLLSDSAFISAWEVGRSMALQQMVAYGLELPDAQKTDRTPRLIPESNTPLTRREYEILRLVADGLSDPEIAAALYISRRTVSTHITHILNKLDTKSRTAAATKALRSGII